MAFAHLWHKRYLPGKKITLLGMLLLAGTQVFSQSVVRENYTKYDQKRVRFGFFLALNQARYKLQHSDAFVNQINDSSGTESSRSVQVNAFPSINFSLGFIGNLKMHDNIDLRFTPGVAFYRRGVEYKGDSILGRTIKGGLEEKVVESAMVELPLLFKIKSNRRKNIRMYFIGGFKHSIDVTNRKEDQANPETVLRGAATDFAIEYGFGMDLYYPFFKFGPELRFSHGVQNMHMADMSAYARAIKRLNTHTVTLLLQFE